MGCSAHLLPFYFCSCLIQALAVINTVTKLSTLQNHVSLSFLSIYRGENVSGNISPFNSVCIVCQAQYFKRNRRFSNPTNPVSNLLRPSVHSPLCSRQRTGERLNGPEYQPRVNNCIRIECFKTSVSWDRTTCAPLKVNRLPNKHNCS